jgi:hypothetical protein
MVVTQSLAKGAVREAMRRHIETGQDLFNRLRKTGIEPPSTRRRYAEWFRNHAAVFEKDALLIAHSVPNRRKGAFAAYRLESLESDGDWRVKITVLRIEFSPGRMERLDTETLPVTISGHALERVFQRTDSIDWRVIRDYLAGAILFANAVGPAWLKSSSQQCAVLAEKGMLVGQVVDHALRLRTFLPETQLGVRWEALYRELNAFSAEHKQAINAAALGLRDEASIAFNQFLESGRHRWLFRPYIPGEDVEEDAWRRQEPAS